MEEEEDILSLNTNQNAIEPNNGQQLNSISDFHRIFEDLVLASRLQNKKVEICIFPRENSVTDTTVEVKVLTDPKDTQPPEVFHIDCSDKLQKAANQVTHCPNPTIDFSFEGSQQVIPSSISENTCSKAVEQIEIVENGPVTLSPDEEKVSDKNLTADATSGCEDIISEQDNTDDFQEITYTYILDDIEAESLNSDHFNEQQDSSYDLEPLIDENIIQETTCSDDELVDSFPVETNKRNSGVEQDQNQEISEPFESNESVHSKELKDQAENFQVADETLDNLTNDDRSKSSEKSNEDEQKMESPSPNLSSSGKRGRPKGSANRLKQAPVNIYASQDDIGQRRSHRVQLKYEQYLKQKEGSGSMFEDEESMNSFSKMIPMNITTENLREENNSLCNIVIMDTRTIDEQQFTGCDFMLSDSESDMAVNFESSVSDIPHEITNDDILENKKRVAINTRVPRNLTKNRFDKKSLKDAVFEEKKISKWSKDNDPVVIENVFGDVLGVVGKDQKKKKLFKSRIIPCTILKPIDNAPVVEPNSTEQESFQFIADIPNPINQIGIPLLDQDGVQNTFNSTTTLIPIIGCDNQMVDLNFQNNFVFDLDKQKVAKSVPFPYKKGRKKVDGRKKKASSKPFSKDKSNRYSTMRKSNVYFLNTSNMKNGKKRRYKLKKKLQKCQHVNKKKVSRDGKKTLMDKDIVDVKRPKLPVGRPKKSACIQTKDQDPADWVKPKVSNKKVLELTSVANPTKIGNMTKQMTIHNKQSLQVCNFVKQNTCDESEMKSDTIENAKPHIFSVSGMKEKKFNEKSNCDGRVKKKLGRPRKHPIKHFKTKQVEASKNHEDQVSLKSSKSDQEKEQIDVKNGSCIQIEKNDKSNQIESLIEKGKFLRFWESKRAKQQNSKLPFKMRRTKKVQKLSNLEKCVNSSLDKAKPLNPAILVQKRKPGRPKKKSNLNNLSLVPSRPEAPVNHNENHNKEISCNDNNIEKVISCKSTPNLTNRSALPIVRSETEPYKNKNKIELGSQENKIELGSQENKIELGSQENQIELGNQENTINTLQSGLTLLKREMGSVQTAHVELSTDMSTNTTEFLDVSPEKKVLSVKPMKDCVNMHKVSEELIVKPITSKKDVHRHKDSVCLDIGLARKEDKKLQSYMDFKDNVQHQIKNLQSNTSENQDYGKSITKGNKKILLGKPLQKNSDKIKYISQNLLTEQNHLKRPINESSLVANTETESFSSFPDSTMGLPVKSRGRPPKIKRKRGFKRIQDKTLCKAKQIENDDNEATNSATFNEEVVKLKKVGRPKKINNSSKKMGRPRKNGNGPNKFDIQKQEKVVKHQPGISEQSGIFKKKAGRPRKIDVKMAKVLVQGKEESGGGFSVNKMKKSKKGKGQAAIPKSKSEISGLSLIKDFTEAKCDDHEPPKLEKVSLEAVMDCKNTMTTEQSILKSKCSLQDTSNGRACKIDQINLQMAVDSKSGKCSNELNNATNDSLGEQKRNANMDACENQIKSLGNVPTLCVPKIKKRGRPPKMPTLTCENMEKVENMFDKIKKGRKKVTGDANTNPVSISKLALEKRKKLLTNMSKFLYNIGSTNISQVNGVLKKYPMLQKIMLKSTNGSKGKKPGISRKLNHGHLPIVDQMGNLNENGKDYSSMNINAKETMLEDSKQVGKNRKDSSNCVKGKIDKHKKGGGRKPKKIQISKSVGEITSLDNTQRPFSDIDKDTPMQNKGQDLLSEVNIDNVESRQKGDENSKLSTEKPETINNSKESPSKKPRGRPRKFFHIDRNLKSNCTCVNKKSGPGRLKKIHESSCIYTKNGTFKHSISKKCSKNIVVKNKVIKQKTNNEDKKKIDIETGNIESSKSLISKTCMSDTKVESMDLDQTSLSMTCTPQIMVSSAKLQSTQVDTNDTKGKCANMASQESVKTKKKIGRPRKKSFQMFSIDSKSGEIKHVASCVRDLNVDKIMQHENQINKDVNKQNISEMHYLPTIHNQTVEHNNAIENGSDLEMPTIDFEGHFSENKPTVCGDEETFTLTSALGLVKKGDKERSTQPYPKNDSNTSFTQKSNFFENGSLTINKCRQQTKNDSCSREDFGSSEDSCEIPRNKSPNDSLNAELSNLDCNFEVVFEVNELEGLSGKTQNPFPCSYNDSSEDTVGYEYVDDITDTSNSCC